MTEDQLAQAMGCGRNKALSARKSLIGSSRDSAIPP
jgi:hypothetical protein